MNEKNHICPFCKKIFPLYLTDIDLSEANQTQANMWKAKYFEMRQEVVKANKGIRQLKKRLHTKF